MKKTMFALLCACSMLAHTQEAPRHIDFTKVLIGLDEKAIHNIGPAPDYKDLGEMTLGDAAVYALEGQSDDDRAATGQQKFDRDTLARKIYKGKSVVLTAEELDLIKTRIGKLYTSSVIGAAWRLLDPAQK